MVLINNACAAGLYDFFLGLLFLPLGQPCAPRRQEVIAGKAVTDLLMTGHQDSDFI